MGVRPPHPPGWGGPGWGWGVGPQPHPQGIRDSHTALHSPPKLENKSMLLMWASRSRCPANSFCNEICKVKPLRENPGRFGIQFNQTPRITDLFPTSRSTGRAFKRQEGQPRTKSGEHLALFHVDFSSPQRCWPHRRWRPG